MQWIRSTGKEKHDIHVLKRLLGILYLHVSFLIQNDLLKGLLDSVNDNSCYRSNIMWIFYSLQGDKMDTNGYAASS